jgi:hypothetical protein
VNTKKDRCGPAIKTHDEMLAEWMRDPAFKTEYDALAEENDIE